MKKTHMTEKRSNMLVPTVVAGAVVLMLGVMAQPVYAQAISGTVDGALAVAAAAGGGDEIADDTAISIDMVSASDLEVTDGADDADGIALTVTGDSGGSDPALVVTEGGVSTDSLTSTGETNLGGTLDVAGTTNLSGDTVIGTEATASTVSAGSSVTPGAEATRSDLTVTGDVVIGTAEVAAGPDGAGAITASPSTLRVNGDTTPEPTTESDPEPSVAVTINGTRALHVRGASQLGEVTIGLDSGDEGGPMPANLTVNGASNVTGNSTVGGTLGVTGATTLGTSATIGTAATKLTINGDNGADGDAAAVKITGDKSLDVDGTSMLRGATTVNNTLGVTGATTLGGATTVNNTLNVAGATTLASATTVNNTLNVAGATTLGGTPATIGTATTKLTINGDDGADGDAAAVKITGDKSLDVDGTSMLRGATTVNNTLNVTGVTTLGGATTLGTSATIGTAATKLTINGDSGTTDGDAAAVKITGNKSLDVDGTSMLRGATTVNNTLDVAGATNLGGTLGVTGDTNLRDTVIGRAAVEDDPSTTSVDETVTAAPASLTVNGSTAADSTDPHVAVTIIGTRALHVRGASQLGEVTIGEEAEPAALNAEGEVVTPASAGNSADLTVTGATNLYNSVTIGRPAVEATAGEDTAGNAALAEQSANLEVLGTTTTRGLTSSAGITNTGALTNTGTVTVQATQSTVSTTADTAARVEILSTAADDGATAANQQGTTAQLVVGKEAVVGTGTGAAGTAALAGSVNLTGGTLTVGTEARSGTNGYDETAGNIVLNGKDAASGSDAAALKITGSKSLDVGGTSRFAGTSSFAQDVTVGTPATVSGTTATAAVPANLTVLGVTTIGAPVTGGIPGVEGGLMVYGGQTAASGYAVQIHANKALHARGDVTIGTAAVADDPATAVDETVAAVPANLTVNGDTTFNGDVAFKGGIDFGDNAVSVSNDRGNGITTTTAGETAVTGGDDNAAKVALDSDTASLTLRNPSNGEDHGVVIKPTSTTISGGTTSTSLTLNDDEVKFSNEADGTGGPVKVTGIADGTGPYDAVNFGQLQDLESQLSKGIAATTAAANIPQVAQGKTMSVGAGLGGYNGEVAVAVGLHYRLAENAVVRATVATGGKKAAYGLGAALSW